jgi:catechol 2,3-dioxygenase-like lactoylglutathione lyase family enzyme
MLTRIDHVMICVPDLQRGIEQYRKLGFNIHAGGVHTGKGTHNAIAFNQDDYIELLAIRDQAEYKAGSPDGTLTEFIAAGGGIRYVVIQSDDVAADVAAMRKRGVDVGDAIDGGRRTPAGQDLRWRVAVVGPGNPLPLIFIQHMTSVDERRKQVPDVGKDAAGNHPNGVYKLERAYIVTRDAEGDAASYAKVLGVPQPKLHRGTVIMANMAVFELGPTGLGIAQPYAPGPAADALERRGPGPFQALYRTTSMSAAAHWVEEHGVPPLARGVRNTGEHAMLATPDIACGAYIGFVGPE